jgi:hypothetical protein
MHHSLQLGPALPFCTLVGIKAPKLNAEQFIVFQIVVLQHLQEVKRAKDVRKRLTWGHHGCLAAGQFLHACSKY